MKARDPAVMTANQINDALDREAAGPVVVTSDAHVVTCRCCGEELDVDTDFDTLSASGRHMVLTLTCSHERETDVRYVLASATGQAPQAVYRPRASARAARTRRSDMDPNQALKNLREMAARILDSDQDDAETPQLAQELAEQFEALDGWLAGKGFLPSEWSGAR